MALILAGRDDWGGAADLQQRVEPSREQQERLAYILFRADRFRDAHDVWSRLLEDKESAEIASLPARVPRACQSSACLPPLTPASSCSSKRAAAGTGRGGSRR